MQMDILRKWLTEELEKGKRTGKSKGALAAHLGMHNSDISRFLRGDRKRITEEQALLASEFLNAELPKELFANKRLYVKKAPLRGTIEAGILRAKAMEPPVVVSNIPYLPTNSFSTLEQYAFQLSDDSAEDYAPPNAFVIFVDFHDARTTPLHGDIVRVEQVALISGRLKTQEFIEASLRRVEVTRTGIMLRKLSDKNPHVQDLTYDPSDKSLTIRDLAIGYYVMTAEATPAK
jgi:hypothetical protein